MTAGLHLAIVLVVLVGIGSPFAYALTRQWAMAVVFAPLVTGLSFSVAATVAVATGTSFSASAVAAVAITVAGGVSLVRRHRPSPPDALRPLTLVAGAGAVVGVLLAIRRAPIDWDVRSIWMLHAQWLWAGGGTAAHALANPAFAFSHPDYPPLASAAIAAFWLLFGGIDPEVAQLVVSILNASALLAVVVAVDRTLRRPEIGAPMPFPLAPLIVLASAGIAGATATNGYADLLWSAALVAGAVLLLLAPSDRGTVLLGVVCVAAAAATKDEGLLAGAAVLGLAALRVRDLRRWATLATAMVPAVAWAVVARVRGAESYLASSGHGAELLKLDPSVTVRLSPTLHAFWAHGHDELLVASAVTVAVIVSSAIARDRRPLAAVATVWALLAALVGFPVLAYLISPFAIDWHLSTSIDRTSIAPRMWLLVSAAIGAAVVCGRLRRPERRTPSLEAAQ